MESTPPVVVTSRASGYAEIVLRVLVAAAEPLSVAEIRERCELSDRLTRDGIDRLIESESVVVTRRFTPHRRGLPPLVYAIRPGR